MAKFSTGLRNKMLRDASFTHCLTGGTLRIFGGPAPETADAAETGTLLMVIRNEADDLGLTFGDPVDGVIGKPLGEVWSTNATLAAGEMTHFRFVSEDDDEGGTASTAAPRIQGKIGLVGADLLVTSPTVEAGVPWTLNYFNVGLPTE